jgi:HEAT repeat protein
VKIGPASVNPLISMLSDTDPDIRIRAAKSLGEIGHESAIEPLERLLKDKDPEVRYAAYNAAERIKRREK